MLYASILLIILVIGVLIYALASNVKVAELGKIMFFCALLAFCLGVGNHVVTLIR